jgi:hypothetical protein
VSPPPGTFFRLVVAGVAGGRRVEKTCQRGLRVCREVANGFLRSALTGEEMTELGLALYEVEPGLEAHDAGLFPWEATWYASSLPPAPAHVLVLAAGEGREARALIGQGYSVDALEPTRSFCGKCGAIEGIGDVVPATFLDLVDAVLGSEPNTAAALAARTYDAAIVGWGGFNHVLARPEQVALLKTCDTLAPGGPLLLSFYTGGAGLAADHASRSCRLGREFGRLTARLRGLPRKEETAGGFAWHAGLYATYTERDLHELAGVVRRRCVLYAEEPYGYATLARR